MSNLAEKLHQYQHVHEPVQQPKTSVRPVTKKVHVSLGEKMLWTFFGVFIFVCSISLISTKVTLFKLNSANVELNDQVSSLQQTTTELQVEVDSLSSYERIAGIARENGLTINEENVQSLNE